MITLRMLAIASAILVGIPLAFGLALPPSVPGGEIFDMTADAAATIMDLALVEPPQTYDHLPLYDWPEQLVEGHTVFVTIDIPVVPNVTNWTLDIIGDAKCEAHNNYTGVYFYGVPIPTRVHEAHVECHAAGRGFATPDPFLPPDSVVSPMHQTGHQFPYVTPTGERGESTEYAYDVTSFDLTGVPTTTTYYAWSAPFTEKSWTHTDGTEKSWYCPMDAQHLVDMQVTHFNAYTEDELAAHGLFLAE